MPESYNVNRKIANFHDYVDNIDAEEQELKKARRGFTKNSEIQQFPKNSKLKFNKVTKKMDDLTSDMIDDQIETIDQLKEGKRSDINLAEVREKKKKRYRKEIKELDSEIEKLEKKKTEILKNIERMENL